MQIVINIPKGRYEDILSGKEFTMYQCDIRNVLKNGIPLPKGHGRLIDEDALEIQDITIPYGYDWECGETTYTDMEIVRADDIWNAQTIVEADREEQE